MRSSMLIGLCRSLTTENTHKPAQAPEAHDRLQHSLQQPQPIPTEVADSSRRICIGR